MGRDGRQLEADCVLRLSLSCIKMTDRFTARSVEYTAHRHRTATHTPHFDTAHFESQFTFTRTIAAAASFRAARSEARAHGFTLDSRAPSGRFNLNNVYGSGALAAEPPPVDVSRGPSAATLRLKGSSPLNLKGVAVGSPPRIGANNPAAPS